MSLALYRTYRPSRLSEVIGQEHVTEPLRRALTSGNVHHAFLFSGPRGCGKTSTARILARSLICEKGPTPDPCGTCDFCVALAPNGPGLVDVIELDAASHGGVDDTRELRERAAFVPAQARYKVYIIDEAHMVTKDGFNALLKLIEEPPDHLKFIFATTEVDKVLPTIRSRTFNYAFRLVPSRQLQQNLAGICDAEGVAFEPGALSLIARASGGSVRDAQSIMGQLIAGAGPDGLQQVEVGEQLGVTDEALLDDVVGAVATGDGAEVFAAVTRVVESGHDVRRFVTDLLHQFRDLLLLTHIGDAANEDVLDVTTDRLEVLQEQAGQFGSVELTRLAEVINEGLTHIKGSTSPRLQLEVLIARLLIPASDTNPESLLSRIEVLERRLSALASGAERPTEASSRPAEATDPAAVTHAAASSTAPDGSPAQSGSNDAVPQSAEATTPVEARQPATTPSAGGGSRAPGGQTPPENDNAARAAQASGPPRSGPPKPPAMSSLRDLDTPATPAPPPPPPPPAGPTSAAPPSVPAPSDAGPPRGDRHGPPAPPQPEPPGAGSEDLQRIHALWPQLMANIREQSRVAAASWEGAEPLLLENGTLTVRVPSKGQEASIRGSRRDLAMHTTLVQDFGIDVQVKATSESVEADNPAPDTPADDDPDLGSNDLSGVDLAVRELGATRIGEIEGS